MSQIANDINLTKKKDLNKKPISINAEYPFDVTDQALLDKRETNKINVEIDQISYKKFKNWKIFFNDRCITNDIQIV